MRERGRARSAAWKRKNHKKLRASASRRAKSDAALLNDAYLRNCLRFPSTETIPPALLEAKRVQLQIYRLVNHKEKN